MVRCKSAMRCAFATHDANRAIPRFQMGPTQVPGKYCFPPPPTPLFRPEGIFFREGRGGGIHLEAFSRKDFYTPPLCYTPPPLEGYFQGWGGIKFGPVEVICAVRCALQKITSAARCCFLQEDTVRWGGILTREGVAVKKIDLSLESHAEKYFCQGMLDILLGYPRALRAGVQKLACSLFDL